MQVHYIYFKIKSMYLKLTDENDKFDDLLEDWRSIYSDIDVYATRIVGRLMEVSKILGRSNLYRSEVEVLSSLYRTGPPFQLSPSQLMKQVSLTSGAMTALLNRIEKQGLIHRIPDSNDGRVSSAGLSPKGVEFIDNTIGLRLDNDASIISIFDDFEKRQFAQLLKKMLKHLNERDH